MRALPTRLDGLVLVESDLHEDARGFLVEGYREDVLRGAGVGERFVQDNHSRSWRGVLRGMHLSVGPGQAKLVRCVRGSIFDVAVDVRRGSPTFGGWEGFVLDDRAGTMLYLPVGFAHGFLVTSEVADVIYKCSSYYDPALERGFRFDDPEVGVDWPEAHPVLSARDRAAPLLREIADGLPFAYGP